MRPVVKCHIVALPYPGRGHINPMMNVCHQLSTKKPDILVTFVVTEEWAGLIGSDPKPENIVLVTVPNVIPSEHGRANDFPGFVQAVNTKLEAPFEQLLDQLVPRPSIILADTLIKWVTGVSHRTNVPVALLWVMSASVFQVFHHFHLLRLNGHFPAKLSEKGQEVVNYIPGVSATRLMDLTTFFDGDGLKLLPIAEEAFSYVSKAKYLLFTSVYELEPEVFEALKVEFPFPVYSIGPSIPHSLLIQGSSSDRKSNNDDVPNYVQWLDSQPEGSVLYISFGSFLSVSSVQMNEIVAGVNDSGVRYIWVARGDTSKINGNGCRGIVVPWCDQLRVLCHSSVGGFWTHCGWNSTLEGVFSGVPMLTFPIFWDQNPNSKKIVEDWKIGYRVRKYAFGDDSEENLVMRDEISETIKRFMDFDNTNSIAMRKRVKELQAECHRAIADGGSSDININDFIKNIS